MELKQGDIVKAKDLIIHPHPIVFLKDNEDGSFNACILSTKPTGKNVLMQPTYFCEFNENGDAYNVVYKKSHLVIDSSYIKKDDWVDGEVVGRLTPEGIKFVEEIASKEFHFCPHPINHRST